VGANWFIRTVCMCILAALLCACRAQGGKEAVDQAAPGVTETRVTLGSSLALTGHASYLGSQTLRGALCYLKHVNETGGVHGRQVELLPYDDAYQ
jgi:ABC-type branched-chain amino acid transport systems, periplasmic component